MKTLPLQKDPSELGSFSVKEIKSYKTICSSRLSVPESLGRSDVFWNSYRGYDTTTMSMLQEYFDYFMDKAIVPFLPITQPPLKPSTKLRMSVDYHLNLARLNVAFAALITGCFEWIAVLIWDLSLMERYPCAKMAKFRSRGSEAECMTEKDTPKIVELDETESKECNPTGAGWLSRYAKLVIMKFSEYQVVTVPFVSYLLIGLSKLILNISMEHIIFCYYSIPWALKVTGFTPDHYRDFFMTLVVLNCGLFAFPDFGKDFKFLLADVTCLLFMQLELLRFNKMYDGIGKLLPLKLSVWPIIFLTLFRSANYHNLYICNFISSLGLFCALVYAYKAFVTFLDYLAAINGIPVLGTNIPIAIRSIGETEIELEVLKDNLTPKIYFPDFHAIYVYLDNLMKKYLKFSVLTFEDPFQAKQNGIPVFSSQDYFIIEINGNSVGATLNPRFKIVDVLMDHPYWIQVIPMRTRFMGLCQIMFFKTCKRSLPKSKSNEIRQLQFKTGQKLTSEVKALKESLSKLKEKVLVHKKELQATQNSETARIKKLENEIAAVLAERASFTGKQDTAIEEFKSLEVKRKDLVLALKSLKASKQKSFEESNLNLQRFKELEHQIAALKDERKSLEMTASSGDSKDETAEDAFIDEKLLSFKAMLEDKKIRQKAELKAMYKEKLRELEDVNANIATLNEKKAIKERIQRLETEKISSSELLDALRGGLDSHEEDDDAESIDELLASVAKIREEDEEFNRVFSAEQSSPSSVKLSQNAQLWNSKFNMGDEGDKADLLLFGGSSDFTISSELSMFDNFVPK